MLLYRILTDIGNFCLWGTTILLLLWIIQYSLMEQWWRNAIGIRIVGLAFCVVIIYVPSMLAGAYPSAFGHFASTIWYHWLAVGIVFATFSFALLGNITWEYIRRHGKKLEGEEPGVTSGPGDLKEVCGSSSGDHLVRSGSYLQRLEDRPWRVDLGSVHVAGVAPVVHQRQVGQGAVVCRYCEIAGYLLEQIQEGGSACPPGFAHSILTGAYSWHRRCKRPCSCDHQLPEDICDGALLLQMRVDPRDFYRHHAVQGMHREVDHVPPHFGYTRSGHPLHLKTIDYHQANSIYQRFNKRLALLITKRVGTMTCAYVFSLLALCSLPAILTSAFHLHTFPAWMVSAGLILLVSWVTQTYIQLVLLSVIMVGQDVASRASDARAAKTFDDTEIIVDRLDVHTQGGIADIEAHLTALEARLPGGTHS